MTESIFQTNENNKSADFRENPDLNGLLLELSTLLKPVQLEKQKNFTENKYPIAFIIGNPRSGTTLFLQWMASLGLFSYPTNVLNHFAYAPYIGALIQQMLFNPDYDFQNEFGNTSYENSFSSNLGKTKGALATSEFQHFFRNFMPNFDPEYLSVEQLEEVDFKGIKNGLTSIESVFRNPFVTKAMMLQYNLTELYKTIPNSIFFHIKREPIYNMQSLLLAREKYYSDRNIWLSVKPKEYSVLKDMDVYQQIAGQVFYTNKEIEDGLKDVPVSKKIAIQYEDFCDNPELYYNNLRKKYKTNGYNLPEYYSANKEFDNTNKIKLSKKEVLRLEKAYQYFEEK